MHIINANSNKLCRALICHSPSAFRWSSGQPAANIPNNMRYILYATLGVSTKVLTSLHAFVPVPTTEQCNAQRSYSSKYSTVNERSAGTDNPILLFLSKRIHHDDVGSNNQTVNKDAADENQKQQQSDDDFDTIRVRIWRVLSSGEEISMTQLSKQVGESRSDVRSHLKHVERQAKTIRNKSNEWRTRRGLSPVVSPKKMQVKKRRGAKNEVFIKLV